EIFQHRTVAELATVADDRAGEIEALAEFDGGGVGFVPLPPVARYLLELGGGHNRFAMSIGVDTPAGADEAALVATLTAVVDRHDLLRSRLVPGGLEVPAPGPADVAALLRRVEWDGRWDEGWRERAAAEFDAAAGRLDPARGVMGQFVWFPGAAGPGRMLIVLHHLVIDGVSWRILLPDLAAAWRLIRDGEPPVLDAVGTSARRWVSALADEAAAPARVAELDLWRSVVQGADPVLGARPFDPALDVMSTVE